MSLRPGIATLAALCLLVSCSTLPSTRIIDPEKIDTLQVSLVNESHKVFILRVNAGMPNYTVEVSRADMTTRTAMYTFQTQQEAKELLQAAAKIVDDAVSHHLNTRSDVGGDMWLVSITSGAVAIDVAIGPQPKSAALRKPFNELTTLSKQLVERALATLPPF